MFRAMRRIKQQIAQTDCEAVLRQAQRGVLAVHGEDGYPYALPMDFLYQAGKIYFHCAKEGHKLDALAADDRVSFCVMDEGYREPGAWPLHIRSVIAFGRIKQIDDMQERIDVVRRLAQRYYPSQEEIEREISSSSARMLILEMTLDHMTGKLVKES